MKNIKLFDLFSGIGGFRLGLKKAAEDLKIGFNCIGFSEIDKYATSTYKTLYSDNNNEIEIGDIIDFTSDKDNIKQLPDFNFLTGGFPCQPFSMMGAKKGFEDERGGLFFNILKILDEKKPQYVLLENVRNIKLHNNGKTLILICKLLKEHGYNFVKYDIFNTADFGLPQKRNRVYILAVRDKNFLFPFTNDTVLANYNKIKNKSVFEYNNIIDILEKKVDDKYYLSEKIKPTILANGSGKFLSKSEINQIIARPLTATMVKMHRACQDNYYSDDFIISNGERNDALLPSDILGKKNIRKLTPSEAFALQGFPKTFVEKAQKAGLSNHQLYKQAGNAVSVNVVYAIVRYILNNLGETHV